MTCWRRAPLLTIVCDIPKWPPSAGAQEGQAFGWPCTCSLPGVPRVCFTHATCLALVAFAVYGLSPNAAKNLSRIPLLAGAWPGKPAAIFTLTLSWPLDAPSLAGF